MPSDRNSKSFDDLKQNIEKSCQDMFSIAYQALSEHNNLKKVVIMEHTPRFDDEAKANLAKYANKTLHEILKASPMKHNIVVGGHNLKDFGIGKTHENRYWDKKTRKYDGVHYYGLSGPDHYTRSVKNIFLSASLGKLCDDTCTELGNVEPQSNWIIPPRKRTSSKQVIQAIQPLRTENRFEAIGQGN